MGREKAGVRGQGSEELGGKVDGMRGGMLGLTGAGRGVCSCAIALSRRQGFDDLIKVRLEQPVLHDAVFFKLALGVRLCQFRRHFARVLEDFTIPELEEKRLCAGGAAYGCPVAAVRRQPLLKGREARADSRMFSLLVRHSRGSQDVAS